MNLANWPADAPMCTSGKRPYRTEEEVQRALRGAQAMRQQHDRNQARRPGVVEKGVYECAVCHWWHMESGKVVVNAKGEGAKRKRRKKGGPGRR